MISGEQYIETFVPYEMSTHSYATPEELLQALLKLPGVEIVKIDDLGIHIRLPRPDQVLPAEFSSVSFYSIRLSEKDA